MPKSIALLGACLAAVAALSVTQRAAAEEPGTINEAPMAPGAERPSEGPLGYVRHTKWEVQGMVGAGIGWGFGARAGYTFDPGIYAGGSFLWFAGPGVQTLFGDDREPQTVIGGDFGYRYFLTPEIELRPFFFGGFGLFDRLNIGTGIVDQSVDLTLSPAFLAAYHMGNGYVSAEARLQVAPQPTRFALMAGVGFGI